MDLIIGGAYQGKRNYVTEQYGLQDSDISDGNGMKSEDYANIKAVSQVHLWVRSMYEQGKEPIEEMARLLEVNPDVILIMDEVGNGIVPIDKKERMWREQAGRTGCYLAKRASKVIRLVCGLPQQIK